MEQIILQPFDKKKSRKSLQKSFLVKLKGTTIVTVESVSKGSTISLAQV